MGLFKPGWMSHNENKAIEASGKLANQAELARAAVESPHWAALLEKLKVRSCWRRSH